MGLDSATTVVAGDLFEKEKDLQDDSIWLEAGSEQRIWTRVLEMAHVIVPSQGGLPPFKHAKASK